jgi:hypothetical protein
MEYTNVSTIDLGEVTVLNEQGEPVKLSTLWRERTAALVFVRHFG